MKSRGFTLIEIIVSLAIFSVVAVIAIGALVRVTSANRQAQAIQSGVNNVSFILDSMSRELRVGTGYKCYTGVALNSNNQIPTNLSSSCLSTNTLIVDDPGALIEFTSSNIGTDSGGNSSCNLVYAYLFSKVGTTTKVYKAEEGVCNQGIANATFYPITSQSVNITGYDLGVFSVAAQNGFLWTYIRLKGYVGSQVKDQSVFDVQTGISQRNNTI